MNQLSRRELLRRSACGFGGMALAGLPADEARPSALQRFYHTLHAADSQ